MMVNASDDGVMTSVQMPFDPGDVTSIGSAMLWPAWAHQLPEMSRAESQERRDQSHQQK